MEIDVQKSRVRLADRWFPAAAILCPLVEGQKESDWDRGLGGQALNRSLEIDEWDVFIPSENGVLYEVDEIRDDGQVFLELRTRSVRCSLARDWPDVSSLWLPTPLNLHGRSWIPEPWGCPKFSGVDVWSRCEEEWIVEHIDRTSVFPVVSWPTGQYADAELVPLSRAVEWAEEHKALQSQE